MSISGNPVPFMLLRTTKPSPSLGNVLTDVFL